MRAAAAVVLGLALFACTDDAPGPARSTPSTTVAMSEAYGPPANVRGAGTIEPSTAKVGTSITLTPASVVDRRCADTAGVVRMVGTGAEPVGFLGPGATWQPSTETTGVTFLACGGGPNDGPATYVVPLLPAGEYRICLWSVAESCGQFVVTA